jgi:hypothetical protein
MAGCRAEARQTLASLFDLKSFRVYRTPVQNLTAAAALAGAIASSVDNEFVTGSYSLRSSPC